MYPNNPAVTGTVFVNGVKVVTWAFQYKESLPKTELIVPPDVLKSRKLLDTEIKIDGVKAPTDLGSIRITAALTQTSVHFPSLPLGDTLEE